MTSIPFSGGDIITKVSLSKLRTSTVRRGEIARGEVRSEENCQLNTLFCEQFGAGAVDMRKLVTTLTLYLNIFYHLPSRFKPHTLENPSSRPDPFYLISYTFDFTLTIPDNNLTNSHETYIWF